MSDEAVFVSGALFCVQRYRGNLDLSRYNSASRWQIFNLHIYTATHSVSLWDYSINKFNCITVSVCGEWGGAESRGNGARPVEWMIMNDTCTTHRSRVPRRSFGRVKWGVTTVEDKRGPGLEFSLCFVCGSRPWGAAAFLLCLFILLLKC